MNKLNSFIQSIASLYSDLKYGQHATKYKIDTFSDIISDSETIIKICNDEIEKLI